MRRAEQIKHKCRSIQLEQVGSRRCCRVPELLCVISSLYWAFSMCLSSELQDSTASIYQGFLLLSSDDDGSQQQGIATGCRVSAAMLSEEVTNIRQEQQTVCTVILKTEHINVVVPSTLYLPSLGQALWPHAKWAQYLIMKISGAIMLLTVN